MLRVLNAIEILLSRAKLEEERATASAEESNLCAFFT